MTRSAHATILAIETSGDTCSIAVMREGRVREERSFLHEMHLSERLLEIIETSLAAAGSSKSDIDLIAVGVGPGSFTGVRIGVMTAKTLGDVLGLPLCGIDALTAMASEYSGLQGEAILPILPCRAGIVYAGLYTVSGDAPACIAAPAAITLDALVETAIAANLPRLLLCGPEASRVAPDLTPRLAQYIETISLGIVTTPRAASIARLAALRFAASDRMDDPIDLVPLYIAPPPISTPKRK